MLFHPIHNHCCLCWNLWQGLWVRPGYPHCESQIYWLLLTSCYPKYFWMHKMVLSWNAWFPYVQCSNWNVATLTSNIQNVLFILFGCKFDFCYPYSDIQRLEFQSSIFRFSCQSSFLKNKQFLNVLSSNYRYFPSFNLLPSRGPIIKLPENLVTSLPSLQHGL